MSLGVTIPLRRFPSLKTSLNLHVVLSAATTFFLVLHRSNCQNKTSIIAGTACNHTSGESYNITVDDKDGEKKCFSSATDGMVNVVKDGILAQTIICTHAHTTMKFVIIG